MHLYHDSHLCRFPAGALPCFAKVEIRLHCDAEIKSASLRFYDGSEKWLDMARVSDTLFSVQLSMPDIPLLCWYDFRAEDQQGHRFSYGAPSDGLGGEGHIGVPCRAFQITVYDPAYDTPHWLRSGIMYQIFPDRFHKSGQAHPRRADCTYHESWQEVPSIIPEGEDDNCARDFFGGDLAGILQKLEALKALGVTVLYLNPIFQARSNHRYDTADYTKVDSHLGTEADFSLLCEKAKEMGIRILLDGVFSHTGEDSIYFNRFGHYPSVGAYQSPASPYYPWYTFEAYPEKYACWWNVHTLPTLNKACPAYMEFALGENGVVRHWQKAGASGWRLDVADELPLPFLRRLRAAVKAEDPDAAVLGEVWEDASRKEAYGVMRCYCSGDTLDSVMNYPLRSAALDFLTRRCSARELKRLIDSQIESYPKPFYYSLMNLAGSHDRARVINVLSECTWEEVPPAVRSSLRLSEDRYRLGAARYVKLIKLLCALPGIPCIYYGDEVGMQGGNDPFCRGPYPWGEEDTALRDAIRALLWQRRESRVLQTGEVEILAPDDETLVVRRFIQNGRDAFGDAANDAQMDILIRR